MLFEEKLRNGWNVMFCWMSTNRQFGESSVCHDPRLELGLQSLREHQSILPLFSGKSSCFHPNDPLMEQDLLTALLETGCTSY